MDLHIHSTYSHGEYTPGQLVSEARKKGVFTIAITDHDGFEGYKEALPLAEDQGIKLISGMELNTTDQKGEIHILGYNFDPDHARLNNYVRWRRQERLQWGGKIAAKLKSLGYDLDWEACRQQAGKGIINRNLIGEQMVRQGYFRNNRAAYEQLLRQDKMAFIPKPDFRAHEAIDLIHEAGGEAYLAHPGVYKTRIKLRRLISYGLDGIETCHPLNKTEDAIFWARQAQKYNLKQSGGSDFHGPSTRSPYPIGSIPLTREIYQQWNSVPAYSAAMIHIS